MIWRALYWLSGVALFVEPFRWWARSRRRRAVRAQAARQEQVRRAQLAALEAQSAAAGQEAWRAFEDRQRAAEAHRQAQPRPCRHCRQPVAPAALRCSFCGAPAA